MGEVRKIVTLAPLLYGAGEGKQNWAGKGCPAEPPPEGALSREQELDRNAIALFDPLCYIQGSSIKWVSVGERYDG